MKYCKKTTLEHPISAKYPSQVECINGIFENEGHKGKLFEKEEKAINLDEIERKLCKGKRGPKRTVDIAVGISKDGRGCKTLLTELKLKVANPNTIGRKDIEDKIKHSIEILSHNPSIHQNIIILFNSKKVSEARRIIAKLFMNTPKSKIIVKSPIEFKQEYFDK